MNSDQDRMVTTDRVKPGRKLGLSGSCCDMHDCLDLIQILISEQFVYETCVPDGRLEYLLPADRHVFQRLAEYDSLYESLYSQVDSEENGILRYGKRFYEDFYTKRDLLLQLLWERAGWKP